MKKRILAIFLSIFSLLANAQNINAYLEACVFNDTLFIDVMVQNNTGSSFNLGASNFVFDIVDAADNISSSVSITSKVKIDSADGPWDDSGNGDYYDMTLNNTSNFVNLTIVPDESNGLGTGPNTGTNIPNTATRVGQIAVPVLICGDTVNLRWRYRNRLDGLHTWLGSSFNMGTGTYTSWGFPTVDSTQLFSFTDLNNVLLCNNICSAQPISLVQSPDSLCYNDPVTFKVPDASPGDSIYFYVNGSIVQGGTVDSVTFNATGNDSVWAEVVNNGCAGCPAAVTNSIGISLLSSDTMQVNAGVDTTINEGEIINLNGSVIGTNNFYWTPSTGLSDATILNPTATLNDTITFILVGQGLIPRCEVYDTVTINVIENELEVRNLFTPNGDGVNDNWTVNDLDEVANCKVQIYSRWGILIYEAEPYLNDWDGTEDGKPLPGGAYYYVFTCSDRDKPIIGDITLVR